MIAITVMLVGVIVPVVFTISGDATTDEPTVDFAFSYAEDVDEGQEDTFGNTKGDVDATGLVTIVFDNGDVISPEQLEIMGVASGGLLADSDEYADQTRFVPGQTITVWANRGEDVQVVWYAEDGGASAILDQFPIRPLSDLPIYVPEPDAGCDWVEDEIDGDDNLVVDDTVVQCDLDAYDIDNLDIVNGGAVIGNVTANEDVTLDDGATYLDDVEAGGHVTLTDDSLIDGDVSVGTDTGGNLDVTDSEVSGGATVDGTVTLTDGSIGDDVDATGAVELVGGSVYGEVSSNDEISLDEESSIASDVDLDDVATDLNCEDNDASTVAGVGCEEYKSATYLVSIEDATTPVEGDQMEVTVGIENTGFESGDQEIALLIDGDEKATDSSVVVDGQTESTITLVWDTDDGDAGYHDAVVESEDDEATQRVQVASSDRVQTDLVFEIDGEGESLAINRDDTVPYSATAEFDDSSTEDVTGEVAVEVISGDAGNVSIDTDAENITGENPGTVTIEANDSNGEYYTDTVELTVRAPMDERIELVDFTPDGPKATIQLENTGDGEVEIDSLSVESAETASGNPDKVDNDGNWEVEGGDSYIDTQSIEIGGSPRSFTGYAIVEAGTTESFDIQEFRQHNGNVLDVEEFTFTLYFSDGSETQFDTTEDI